VTYPEKRQRIALFGGTFDPVHEGHVAIAQYVKKKVALDRILWIPAADPPHKQTTGAPFKQRVAMLEQALAGVAEDSEISLIESELPAPSYTVDTLLELGRRLGNQIYYFILGADSLLELHLWYRYQELPDLTNIIVMGRPGISCQAVELAIAGLPGPFKPEPARHLWRREDATELIYLPEQSLDISSTTIRRQLADGHYPDSLNSRVRDYIIEQQLYRTR